MSNRRVDDDLYGRPSRSGMWLSFGLMALAMVIGVVVLQNVDKAPGTSVKTPGTDVVAGDTTATDDTLGTDVSTTTIAAAIQRDPALVKVIVTNGSGVNKAAKKVSDFLVPSRFNMITPRDATASNLADAVFFTPGFESEAATIANLLGPIEMTAADGTVTQALPTVAALPLTSSIRTPPAAPAFDVQVMVGPGLAKKYRLATATADAAVVTTTTAAA